MCDRQAPGPVREHLRAWHLGAALHFDTSVRPILHRTLHALQAAGLEPIVLKGAALAYTAYPQPAHRTFSDIDLLLPGEQPGVASRVLREIGFWTSPNDPEPSHHIRPHYAEPGGLGIELHHELLPRPHPYTIELTELQARARTTEIAGLESRVLAPSDALLLACLHLSYSHRYQWFPLRGLVDILAMTTRWGTALNWHTFVETACRWQAGAAAYWPLWMARWWLGAPIPEGVLTRVAPPSMLRRLVGVAAEPSFILERRPPSERGGEVLHALLLELSLYTDCPVREKLRILRRRLFPPPSAVGHLPTQLTSSRVRYIAHMLRPRRLANGLAAAHRVMGRLQSP